MQMRCADLTQVLDWRRFLEVQNGAACYLRSWSNMKGFGRSALSVLDRFQGLRSCQACYSLSGLKLAKNLNSKTPFSRGPYDIRQACPLYGSLPLYIYTYIYLSLSLSVALSLPPLKDPLQGGRGPQLLTRACGKTTEAPNGDQKTGNRKKRGCPN